MAGQSSKKKDAKAREARQQEIFDGLRGLLTSLGNEVTVSKTLEGRGGDCLVKGERRVIVSRRLPLSDRIDVLVDVLARQDLSGVAIPEDLAEVLEPVLRDGQRAAGGSGPA